MTDKTDIWDKLRKTDPSQTKTFKRAGGFSGTAIKPIYQIQKMTEVFGPAGIGWGTDQPVFEVVPGDHGEVLVYCTVGLWINPNEPGVPERIYGVGGDKVVTHIKANEQYKRPERWENDDEAFKKAFTDAIGNAMKHLGMSADVHMGLFDDSKYVREREEEERAPRQVDEERPQPTTMPKAKARPIDAEMRTEIDACQTVEELNILWKSAPFKAEFERMPDDWKSALVEHATEHKEILVRAAAPMGHK